MDPAKKHTLSGQVTGSDPSDTLTTQAPTRGKEEGREREKTEEGKERGRKGGKEGGKRGRERGREGEREGGIIRNKIITERHRLLQIST